MVDSSFSSYVTVNDCWSPPISGSWLPNPESSDGNGRTCRIGKYEELSWMLLPKRNLVNAQVDQPPVGSLEKNNPRKSRYSRTRVEV